MWRVRSRAYRGGKQRSGKIEKSLEVQVMGSDPKGLCFAEVGLAAWRGGLTGGQKRAWALGAGAGPDDLRPDSDGVGGRKRREHIQGGAGVRGLPLGSETLPLTSFE